jgi:hypothetical protein
MAGIKGAEPGLLHQTGMAAVKMFGQAQEDTQDPHNFLGMCIERSKGRIPLTREGLALIEGSGRHQGNFFLVKTQQIGMADKVVSVGLVVSVGQESANVMQ